MEQGSYLGWLIQHTKTCWWHDSADPRELDLGLARGAVGATTNPFLASIALVANRGLWLDEIRAAVAEVGNPAQRAEALMRIPVTHAAHKLLPQFQASGGQRGYVCAQVNPARAGDRAAMLDMARRFRAWSPNITVKLPATAAGLDVLENCVAEGIAVTATVSFTVPQVLAVGERHRAGAVRARAAGIAPGRGFAVIMIGRLDDYLREIAGDTRADVRPTDIQQAGLAVAKRAYALYRQRGYEPAIIIAALRGLYHVTELAGAEMIMSIFPSWQGPLLDGALPREERIDRPVPADVIDRLRRLPEFIRAYEPDGMTPQDFIAYGVTQRTLSQFHDAGWKLMETFAV